MRLIDADELINILEWNKGQEKDALVSINSLIELVKARPTAYDVDKVTHEINNKIQELDAKQQLFIENGMLNGADKMGRSMGIYIECRKIVEKAGD